MEKWIEKLEEEKLRLWKTKLAFEIAILSDTYYTSSMCQSTKTWVMTHSRHEWELSNLINPDSSCLILYHDTITGFFNWKMIGISIGQWEILICYGWQDVWWACLNDSEFSMHLLGLPVLIEIQELERCSFTMNTKSTMRETYHDL